MESMDLWCLWRPVKLCDCIFPETIEDMVRHGSAASSAWWTLEDSQLEPFHPRLVEYIVFYVEAAFRA